MADNTEIQRRRTFAIIAHPDAGKTSLTEKLLLFGLEAYATDLLLTLVMQVPRALDAGVNEEARVAPVLHLLPAVLLPVAPMGLGVQAFHLFNEIGPVSYTHLHRRRFESNLRQTDEVREACYHYIDPGKKCIRRDYDDTPHIYLDLFAAYRSICLKYREDWLISLLR